jgi:NTP pyrophosphatase (non-canonical NTP hydrolase)
MSSAVTELQKRLRTFVAARDWAQFHSPKNLAIGLATEAAEILEVFLWMTEAESSNLSADKLARLKEEIGDVQLYLLNLADKFSLNPLECASVKLETNELKYPADRVRGSAKKYNEY